MSKLIEPHYIKQCDHEICPQQYVFTSKKWNQPDYLNFESLLNQAINEKEKILLNYDKNPIKGGLKFISNDQQMQMLIFKSEEFEIINACLYKSNQN